MSIKSSIKRHAPRSIHFMYNRAISRRVIRGKVGSWFDTEWKTRAVNADDRTWIEVYDESWENWTAPDLSQVDIDLILKEIPDRASVIDVGCGDGFLLNAIRRKAGSLSGVDISSKALLSAKSNLKYPANFVQAFGEHLPYADNSFDVAICTHTLEHVREPELTAAEMARVARLIVVILVPRQEFLPYTEDYHLNFFPDEKSLIDSVKLPNAKCVRHTISEGEQNFAGDILLLTAEQA